MFKFIHDLIYPTIDRCISQFDKAIRNLEYRAVYHSRQATGLFAAGNAHQDQAERATKIAANLSKLVNG